jgi:hypothetical protein
MLANSSHNLRLFRIVDGHFLRATDVVEAPSILGQVAHDKERILALG